MNTAVYAIRQQFGLFFGIILFGMLLLIPAPEGLSAAGWRTAAVALLMGVWWITEALPIFVTALMPIVLFPLLDVSTIGEATYPYANPLIFLFMGGFIIAKAMERWNLHRRIALNIVSRVGTKPTSIIAGFIIASSFLSMWVSNTATALMMLPIALSVLGLLNNGETREDKTNFEIVLLLSIAYACSIGGMGTLIGTPPNALLAGFMHENYGIEISFSSWLLIGLPLMLISLPLLHIMLTRVIYPIRMKELPGGERLIRSQLATLGKITNPEVKVACVFVATAVLWVSRPLLTGLLPGISDAGIAIGAAAVLFIIPVSFKRGEFLLSWTDTASLPWGVLILFGGGLSLASGISSTGLSAWIGRGVQVLDAWPVFFMVLVVLFIIVFLTEMTSNTATTAAFLPILASVAIGLGENPLLLAIPAALGASCAFMLPVATPPNAIVFGSGKVTIPEMSKAGLWLNLLFIFLLSVLSFTLITYVFSIEVGVLPGWAR